MIGALGLCLFLSASAMITIGITNAKYVNADDTSMSAELMDFDIGFTLEYSSVGTQHTVTSGELADSHGVTRLTADEYGTLKMLVDYTGEGKCCYRFRLTESWQHTENGRDIITPKELSDYTLAEGLYDNRSDDGYIYACSALSGTSTSFEVITGCTPGEDAADLISEDDGSEFVDISVELEAVQWNRAKEIWGFTQFPWEEDVT